MQMIQQQVMPQSNDTIIDKVSDAIRNLTQDEQNILASNGEFLQARAIYDRVFIDFLASKYKQDFMATQNGQNSAQNLLDVTNKTISHIKENNRLYMEKIAKLSKIIDENPNILSKLENGGEIG